MTENFISEQYPINAADRIMPKASKETNKPEQTLFNAVASSKLRLIRLLIEGGVNVNSRNDRGQTPLLITCSSLSNTCHARWETREKVVKYLISVGADVNIHDTTGRTPLIYAVITRTSVIFDLIDAGADPWKEDSRHKCAFDYALQNKDLAQVEIMVYAYKKKRLHGVLRDVEDARGITDDNRETRNTRDSDVTDTSDNLQHSKNTSSRKKGRKLSLKSFKNKSESDKKLKVYASKNRKRLAQSINIGIPNLIFNKNNIDPSCENSRRASIPREPPAHHITMGNYENVELFCKDPSSATSRDPCDTRESTCNNPTNPSKMPQIHGNSLLCDLCKGIFSEQLQSKAEILNPSFAEDFNFTDNDISGLLFRRRSTGCLFALKKESHDFYESIRQKRELGLTMEDLFSNTEINEPKHHHLSATELLLPDRSRSASVCLPLQQNDTRRYLQDPMFCSRKDFPFITSAKSVPELHTIAWSRPGSPDFTPESSVYLGSDDECCDMIMPTSCRNNTSSPSRSLTSSPIPDMISSPVRGRTSSPIRSMTSSPIRSITSSPLPDMTSSPTRSRTPSPIRSITSSPIRSMTSSPNNDCQSQCHISFYRKSRPSSALSDNDSVTCSSSIPTIVLTDCVNTDEI